MGGSIPAWGLAVTETAIRVNRVASVHIDFTAMVMDIMCEKEGPGLIVFAQRNKMIRIDLATGLCRYVGLDPRVHLSRDVR